MSWPLRGGPAISITITVSEGNTVLSSSIGGYRQVALFTVTHYRLRREYRIVILDRRLSSGRPFQAERGRSSPLSFLSYRSFLKFTKLFEFSEAAEDFRSCRSFRIYRVAEVF
ncbi:unnamed protein product [Tenebrio molitor]|nr:unnamed protein product [Tenebrio molitor]